ncbi:hypothetical protein WOLCODRAFT_133680 [Wolfiporia cocos MD-104 SS10]|uniref:Alpha/beta-hydrolase n=1 Tax=Wolfiporia cocos (strain MD-104) TaxID=742152 RepID=A0A2H3JE71_WOLCO|nr:hypothetical protein WOLCODRAFT_133680 [Wolfiporia cocos MD-104 SS10]
MFFANLAKSTRPFVFCLSYLGATTMRHSSTAYVLRSPPPSAPREVPTPLVFVSASKWDPRTRQGMRTLASMFAERGFTCLEVDLAPPESISTSESLMQHFEDELSSHIRLTAIPFAPIILARGTGALIAQTYISSHPASGLLLISPPKSNASVSSSSFTSSDRQLLPTPLREFCFEPKFPCAVMCAQDEAATMQDNRLWKDACVDKLIVLDQKGVDGQEGFSKIEQWLDDIGV